VTKRQRTTGPTRTCVGCGSRDAQASMVRLRRGAAGSVVVDSTVQHGRGAYVHAQSDCIRGLVRSKVIGKSLRTTVAKEARMELMQVLDAQLSLGTRVVNTVAPRRESGARIEA
jgi:uncharacterized protein